ncbi:Rab-like protein [Sparganum proliferum]
MCATPNSRIDDQINRVISVKVICLGDSAVGKSKLIERFLLDGYQPQQLSTYALNLYKHQMDIEGRKVDVAHACILVFDVTRKITYKNLTNWLNELRTYRENIPCFCVANKIDADLDVTKKSFNFAKKNNMPFYFVSASNGTNVVRVFTDAVRAAVAFKENSTDILDQIMQELENMKDEETGNPEAQESYVGDLP